MKLSIKGIYKMYASHIHALQDIHFELEPGITALLGPNGSGKTTLIRIMATILQPTRGQVLWNGIDVASDPDGFRKIFGYLPQNFGYYPNLSAREFLLYMASLKGVTTNTSMLVGSVLNNVGLANVADCKLKTFSGGMIQRVGIAQALLNDPQFLVVDEPTTGLDPEARFHFHNLLSKMAGNRIVLMSTHNVADVAAIATKIVILSQGKLVFMGTARNLCEQSRGKVWLKIVTDQELVNIEQQFTVTSVVRNNAKLEVRILSEHVIPGSITIEPSLEDAYFWVLRDNKKC